MTLPDAYANLHDVPSSGDDYQPGSLTAEQCNETDDDNQDAARLTGPIRVG